MYVQEKFQIRWVQEHIKDLNNDINDSTYLELRRNCQYWEEKCRGADAVVAQMEGIIKTLKDLYDHWKKKYAYMAILVNYVIQDFPDLLRKDDLAMCLENTPKEVYHFGRFGQRTMAELTTDVKALRDA